MSKQLQAQIRCPNCKHQFVATLYRTIWIEYPENRKLIFDDKINVVTCPACKSKTKLPFPFLCTNVKEQIAVWYEPYPDADVEKDVQQYAKHTGPRSFYATAPRIQDWHAFKEKIIELEQQTGMRQAAGLSPEMREKFQGFVQSLQEKQKSSPAKPVAEVINYKAGAYCQLKLASRERVLISCAQTGIKIIKLGLGGLIPTKTVAEWPFAQIEAAVLIFADESNPSQHPLEAIKNKLMTCSSIQEIEQLCTGR